MSETPRPITGHCLCGSVTYSVDADPAVQAVCHCTDCQRQTGTAFSVVVGVPREALTVEGDTLTSFTTISEQGTETERNFCSKCGSPLFSLSGAMPSVAFLKSGSLDDGSWLEPAAEVWTGSAQSWSPRFDDAMQFETAPG